MQWNIAPHINAQRVHIGFFRVTVQGYQFVATCTCSTWSANFQTCTHSTVKHFLPLLWRKLPRRVQMIPVSVLGWGANTKGHFSGSVGPCSHCGGIKWSVMLPVTVPAQHESGNKTSKPATGVIWIKPRVCSQNLCRFLTSSARVSECVALETKLLTEQSWIQAGKTHYILPVCEISK